MKSAKTNEIATNAKSRVNAVTTPSMTAVKGAITGGYIGIRCGGPYGFLVGSALGAIVGFIVDEVNN
ncbi:MAG: hypothetical protein V5789_05120 [Colwellia sp.]